MNPSILIAACCVTLFYPPCCFLLSKNYQKTVVRFLNFYSVKSCITGKKNLESWYSTMNYNLMIHVFPIMKIIGSIFFCSSVMTVLLSFIISCRLIIWYLLWFTIIIGGTGCFTWTPIPFWFIFTRAVWLMLYKYSL